MNDWRILETTLDYSPCAAPSSFSRLSPWPRRPNDDDWAPVTALFLVAEVVGGILSNSLALLGS